MRQRPNYKNDLYSFQQIGIQIPLNAWPRPLCSSSSLVEKGQQPKGKWQADTHDPTKSCTIRPHQLQPPFRACALWAKPLHVLDDVKSHCTAATRTFLRNLPLQTARYALALFASCQTFWGRACGFCYAGRCRKGMKFEFIAPSEPLSKSVSSAGNACRAAFLAV